jgi:hypothetical protein
VEDAEERLYQDLEWLGLAPDEGELWVPLSPDVAAYTFVRSQQRRSIRAIQTGQPGFPADFQSYSKLTVPVGKTAALS